MLDFKIYIVLNKKKIQIDEWVLSNLTFLIKFLDTF